MLARGMPRATRVRDDAAGLRRRALCRALRQERVRAVARRSDRGVDQARAEHPLRHRCHVGGLQRPEATVWPAANSGRYTLSDAAVSLCGNVGLAASSSQGCARDAQRVLVAVHRRRHEVTHELRDRRRSDRVS